MTEDDKTVKLSAEMVMSLNSSSELGEAPQKVKFVLNIHRLCRDESSAVSEPLCPGAAHTKAEPYVTPAAAQPYHPRLSHCSHHPSTAQERYRGVSSHTVYSNQPPSPGSLEPGSSVHTLPALMVTSLPSLGLVL